MAEIFDSWVETYDTWFETPMGALVLEYESRLFLRMACPGEGEHILDAGCGTGVFTRYLLEKGARVTGLELSLPMLRRAGMKAAGRPFLTVRGDMLRLPFPDACFDKTVSVTAIEFIKDGAAAVTELFRVTRPGGIVVVAGLNSLSPWAARRTASAKEGHAIFVHAVFRSPPQLADLAPFPATVRTAVHFEKQEEPERARRIEEEASARGDDTGAFCIACWQKPLR
ncbi:MAG: methyltransferase domain-containing protein [Desulfobacteraceae bacterium]|nr:methyltransferase domain-containing protein [Desulfobacteraceae bacterium]